MKDKILHIHLKSCFFEEIKAGKKKVENRDITHYWAKRLIDDDFYFIQFDLIIFYKGYTQEKIFAKHLYTTDKKGWFEIFFEL